MKLRLTRLILQLHSIKDINIVDITGQNVQAVIVSTTKILNEISPVPSVTKDFKLKRRNEQTVNLTSSENIKKLKLKTAPEKAVKKTTKNLIKQTQRELVCTEVFPSSSCSTKQKIKLHVSDSNLSNICVECEENYDLTMKKVDWIQCIRCKRWLHETYTSFVDVCQMCGEVISKSTQSYLTHCFFLL